MGKKQPREQKDLKLKGQIAEKPSKRKESDSEKVTKDRKIERKP